MLHRSEGTHTAGAISIPRAWSIAKRGIDFVGSLMLLGLLSPVFTALYILVARSGGEVFYGHRRIGRNGEWFTCYKFRTMIPDAESVLKRVLAEHPELKAEWDRDEKLRKDPRVTKVGEFLRRTSLDELPQLFNVLRGDMSLVGPRPVTDVGKEHYRRAWRWYLAVRPGMTGLWQVSGRNDVGFRRRIVLDVYYIRNQHLWLDLQILFRTIRVVFGSTGY
ncbi:MAG: sugar transferase [Gammaproteobacteria bacterium]|jgi:lipopolysaccharide/colanic/teichoic acid biosynthesis glycosyltransferase|nr:sugar transferase [Gammaproteobacteria bacterium]